MIKLINDQLDVRIVEYTFAGFVRRNGVYTAVIKMQVTFSAIDTNAFPIIAVWKALEHME